MTRKTLLLFLTLFAFTSLAATFDPAQYKAMQWREVGPYRGGRSAAVEGIASQPERLLLRSDRRRGLEDRRRRRELEAGLRRILRRLHRRGRRRRIRSQRRLRRHRGEDRARQRLPRRRHVEVPRCRENMEAHRSRRLAAHPARPRSSAQSRSRLRRRPRPSVRSQSAARRVPQQRRRQDLGAHPLRQRKLRRDRSHPRSRQPARPLRVDVARAPHAVFTGERRRRLGAVEVDRRRRHLDQSVEKQRPAQSAARHHRRQRLRVESAERLRHRRSSGRRRVPLARRRRDLGENQRRSQPSPAGLVLHPDLRRPERGGHRLRPQRRASTNRKTAARPSPPSPRRTATITTSGSRRTIRSA